MAREILISKSAAKTQVAVIEDGVLDDFWIEVEHHQSLLGNIYKGRVEAILPSINGAFVNIGQDKNGFLYLSDAVNPLIEQDLSEPGGFLKRLFSRKKREAKRVAASGDSPLKVGQEILVQVVKEPFGNKGARLTTHITLAGRFVVYMPCDAHRGVSRKITDPLERERLREIIEGLDFVKTGGFIARTVSMNRPKQELVRDAKFLHKIWQQILKLSEKKGAPALLYKEYDLIWKVVRDYFNDKIDRLTIDSLEDYHKLRRFVETLIGKSSLSKIHYYRGQTPLFDARGITRQLEVIYDTRVPLKSGAYVVIEPTEGLIVVDVNSGRFKTNATPEEAAFMVNMEAAPEIARQLRLRDLGGIIVIDFIDMQKESHKRRVLQALQKALAKDTAKTEVNRISPLGLVEMTRARTGKNIEALSFRTCPYCDGRGKVKII